jgi:hypothetical protein
VQPAVAASSSTTTTICGTSSKAAHTLVHSLADVQLAELACSAAATCRMLLLVPLQVTKVKLEQKQKEGIAEARSGRRGPVS